MSVHPVHVAAAVIVDDNSRILIAQRPSDKHQGGLWEFPGGKVEVGEGVEQALIRELEEELGITPSEFRPLIKIRHDYSDKSVLLDVWRVSRFSGEPHGREGQPVSWVEKSRLSEYQFPAANYPILNAAILPGCYLITGPFQDRDELLERVTAAFNQGVSLVQFHAPWLEEDQYRECVEALLPLFGSGKQLLVKGDVSWLEHSDIAGLHLTSEQLRSLHAEGWSYSGNKLLGASCHSGLQLEQAVQVGASFATLSPVLETASHPESNPLDWVHAGPMVESAAIPVYCQGGMAASHLMLAQRLGAQGIAGTSAWW